MSLHRFFGLAFFTAAVGAAVAVSGCSSAEDDVATGEGEEDLTAKKGQMCGGFAGTLCAEGLKCNFNRGLNTGTCVTDPTAVRQGASEGETCGGTANIGCKSGLTCKKRTSSATSKGTCVASGGVTCQAIPTCDDGHTKVTGPSACPQDDSACYKRALCGKTIWCTGPAEGGGADQDAPGAGVGQMCGGFAGITCKPGLTCDNSLGLNTGRCR